MEHVSTLVILAKQNKHMDTARNMDTQYVLPQHVGFEISVGSGPRNILT